MRRGRATIVSPRDSGRGTGGFFFVKDIAGGVVQIIYIQRRHVFFQRHDRWQLGLTFFAGFFTIMYNNVGIQIRIYT